METQTTAEVFLEENDNEVVFSYILKFPSVCIEII